MSQTFFKETKAPEVKSLNELLQFVSKNGVDPIRDKLTKKTGFLSRIFSNESWNDWLENKTAIGKVVSLYCERVTHSTRLEALMDRLDKKVLEVANKDAALLLQSLEQPGSIHEKETEEKTTSRSSGLVSFHFQLLKVMFLMLIISMREISLLILMYRL